MDELQKTPESVQADPQLVATVTSAVLQTLQTTGHLPAPEDQQKPSQPEVKSIDLVGLFFAIIEKFWIVAICAILGALVMGWLAGRSETTYTATAKLFIVDTSSGSINISNLQLGTVLTMDYQEVFKTWEVHQMVNEQLGLNYGYSQLQGMLSVENPEDTRVLYITIRDTDAQRAADIANAYAAAAKKFITQTMDTDEPSTFSIALVPSVAGGTSITGYIIRGILLGTVLAGGILVLIFLLDNRPKSPEDIMRYANIPTLAVIPKHPELSGDKQHRRKAVKS